MAGLRTGTVSPDAALIQRPLTWSSELGSPASAARSTAGVFSSSLRLSENENGALMVAPCGSKSKAASSITSASVHSYAERGRLVMKRRSEDAK